MDVIYGWPLNGSHMKSNSSRTAQGEAACCNHLRHFDGIAPSSIQAWSVRPSPSVRPAAFRPNCGIGKGERCKIDIIVALPLKYVPQYDNLVYSYNTLRRYYNQPILAHSEVWITLSTIVFTDKLCMHFWYLLLIQL